MKKHVEIISQQNFDTLVQILSNKLKQTIEESGVDLNDAQTIATFAHNNRIKIGDISDEALKAEIPNIFERAKAENSKRGQSDDHILYTLPERIFDINEDTEVGLSNIPLTDYTSINFFNDRYSFFLLPLDKRMPKITEIIMSTLEEIEKKKC